MSIANRLPKGRIWKIAYFAGGVLFIGVSRFFAPFWLRFLVLVLWALGLALIFIKHLEDKDTDPPKE